MFASVCVCVSLSVQMWVWAGIQLTKLWRFEWPKIPWEWGTAKENANNEG